MSATEIMQFIGNMGFPIFVAMYLLIRVEQKIEKLVLAFVDHTEAITRIMNELQLNNVAENKTHSTRK